MRVRVALGALLVLASATFASAQSASQLAGTWERFSVRDDDGKMANPQPPAAFLMMTADGFYSQTAIPTGRPKLNKPLKDMTKDELLARFNKLWHDAARSQSQAIASRVQTCRTPIPPMKAWGNRSCSRSKAMF